MHQFREGRLDVLVATTVIEVGVDVPNATAMVVLDADLRHRPAPSAGAWAAAASSRGATWSAGRTPPRPRPASVPWSRPPTGSSWPRSTSSCAARARSWASARRAAATSRRVAPRSRVGRAGPEVAFAIVDGEGGLEAHADLLDEVALFLDEDDQEFLLKGQCARRWPRSSSAGPSESTGHCGEVRGRKCGTYPRSGSLGLPRCSEVVVVGQFATVEHEAVMAAADVEPEGPLGRTQREGDALALISERLSGRVRAVAPAAVLALGLVGVPGTTMSPNESGDTPTPALSEQSVAANGIALNSSAGEPFGPLSTTTTLIGPRNESKRMTAVSLDCETHYGTFEPQPDDRASQRYLDDERNSRRSGRRLVSRCLRRWKSLRRSWPRHRQQRDLAGAPEPAPPPEREHQA